MTDPTETVSFVSAQAQLRVMRKQKHCFPWDQWLSVYRFVLQECVGTLMNLLAECVSAMNKEDIKSYQSNLFTLFLEALDFRAHHDQEASVKYFRTMWRLIVEIKSKAQHSFRQKKNYFLLCLTQCICLCACLLAWLPVYLPVCVSVCLPFCLFVGLPVYLPVCLSVFLRSYLLPQVNSFMSV